MPYRFQAETREVRQELIVDLACSGTPTTIMGFTLVLVAWVTWTRIGQPVLLVGAAIGAVGTICKLVLMRMQRRRGGATTRWEALHAVCSLSMALGVATVATRLFLWPDANWHVPATGLLFGYCAGVVSRLSVRPWIAVAALTVASFPVIVAAASWRVLQHEMTALTFFVFMIGAVESVRHSHGNAVRQIVQRFDMASLARNDALTGLANRLGLREAFRARPHEQGAAVHCLDLDGFKGVNDRLGHAAGDMVLCEVARRLVAVAGPQACVARLGGDEFVIVQFGADGARAQALADAVVARLREPYDCDGRSAMIGASLGYDIVVGGGDDLETLLERADRASYRAKRNGGGVVRAERGASLRVVPASPRSDAIRSVASR